MNKEQAQKKLDKLQKLIDQGVGGEKETAKRLYDNIYRKYFSLSDESKVEYTTGVKTRYIPYTDKMDLRFITRLVRSIVGQKSVIYSDVDKLIQIDATDYELDLIRAYYEFYKPKLEETITIAWNAFVKQNELYGDESCRVDNWKSTQELQEKYFPPDKLEKINQMTKAIDKNVLKVDRNKGIKPD